MWHFSVLVVFVLSRKSQPLNIRWLILFRGRGLFCSQIQWPEKRIGKQPIFIFQSGGKGWINATHRHKTEMNDKPIQTRNGHKQNTKPESLLWVPLRLYRRRNMSSTVGVRGQSYRSHLLWKQESKIPLQPNTEGKTHTLHIWFPV